VEEDSAQRGAAEAAQLAVAGEKAAEASQPEVEAKTAGAQAITAELPQTRNDDGMPLHGTLRWSTNDSHFRKRFFEDAKGGAVACSDVNLQHYLRVLNLNGTHVVLEFAECSLSTGTSITSTTGFVIDKARAFQLDEETHSKLPAQGNRSFSDVWPTWYQDGWPTSEFRSVYLVDTQKEQIPGVVGLEGSIFPDKFASNKRAGEQCVVYSSKWVALTAEQRAQAFSIIRTIQESRPMYKYFNRHMYTGGAGFQPVVPTGCPCPLQSRLIEIERSSRERWSTLDGHNCMTFATSVFNGIAGLSQRLYCSRDATGAITCKVIEECVGQWELAPQGGVGKLTINGGIARFSLGGVAKVMTNEEEVGSDMTSRTVTMVHENNEQAIYVWRKDGALIGRSGSFWGRKIFPDVLYWWPSESASTKKMVEPPHGCILDERIESGCVALVRGAYFEECLHLGRSIQMRQHIAEHHFWNPQQAINLWRLHGSKYLLVVSYGWLSRSEPDPDRYHLERLACILRIYKQHYCCLLGLDDVAIAMDFCSLWQNEGHQSSFVDNTLSRTLHGEGDNRSSEQQEQFRKGLQAFNDLYIDEHVTALKLSSVPLGVSRGYDDRGWTTAESALIDAKGCGYNKYTFDDTFDPASEDKEGWAFLMKYQCKISPPISPESLAARLEEKRKGCEKKGLLLFTSGKDVRTVPALYEKSFERARSCKERQYGARNWGLPEVRALCDVLPLFDLHGLYLFANRKINDDAVRVLCDTLPSMKTLRFLNLSYCSISIDGIRILLQVIDSGSLSSLQALRLDNNPFCSDEIATSDLQRTWETAGKDPTLLQV